MLSCVYHAYDGDELVATGRLTFDDLPRVGEEVKLNGRRLVVSAVEFRGGEHVVQLAPA